MADNEHVSSTTPLFGDEVHHYQPEPDSEQDKPKPDLFSMDDIVDLVGGARDALDRHLAEDSAPRGFTDDSLALPEEPVTLPEPVHVTEPEPVPEVKEPEPEPDSTSFSFVPDTPSLTTEEPEVIAPKAEPESTKIVPEPQAAPEPEPAPASDALPTAEPRKAAPAPAETAEQPAVTEEPPAPASYVPSPSKAQPHPLMQFPTGLQQQLQRGPLDSQPLSHCDQRQTVEKRRKGFVTLAGSSLIGSCAEDMLMSWRTVRIELSVIWQLSALAPCLLSV